MGVFFALGLVWMAVSAMAFLINSPMVAIHLKVTIVFLLAHVCQQLDAIVHSLRKR